MKLLQDLVRALRARAVNAAHDRLSELLEDPAADNDDIRNAAVRLCYALNDHHALRVAIMERMGGRL